MITRDKLYIGGSWVDPSSPSTMEVVNSTTEEVMGTIPLGNAVDVDRAAVAAVEAFDEWSNTSREERAKFLSRVQVGLSARAEEMASLISGEVGTPLAISNLVQVGLPVMSLASMSQILGEMSFEEEISNSLVVREPVGVVGAITPWNYPLHQIAAKVAPALAAGCTVVLKPSDVAPLNAFLLAEIMDEVGIPAGVFNLVSGPGTVVGEAIALHAAIDMVSFTGSTRAGKRVMQLGAENVKKVTLELGGKSACVILPGADYSAAVAAGVSMCFLNSGQTCSALTRMVVPRSVLGEIEELAVAETANYKVGDPLDFTTRIGPLVSAAQRDRVRGYITKGEDEGAKMLTGGAGQPEGIDRGFFVKPTVFSEVESSMTIAQEEIFGPVLSILPYEDESDALRIANDSIYGLAGAVWAADLDTAEKFGRKIRTGQVDLNGGGFNPVAPFGGYKQSGVGRELGHFGLEEYLQIKSFQR